MQNSSSNILVLDSGIGGVTIWQEIKNRLPNLTCHYLADNAFFPYGNKSEIELEQRIEYLLTRLMEKHQFDLVVIACNSASTAVLDYLRKKFTIPFVGVVPAIKPAAEMSQNKKIGLLATEGTVNRSYTNDLIQQFANDCKVSKVGCKKLAQMAEQKINGQTIQLAELKNIIQPFIDNGVDVCVLGCTHFPWFKPEFQQIAPAIQWIDSGEAIAKRVESLIVATFVLEPEYFYFTGVKYEMAVTKPFERVELFT